MGKATWAMGAWLSLLCIIYFFIAVKVGWFDIAFVAFCSLALYLGQKGNPKKLPYFFCSSLAGMFWGFLNLQATNLLVGAGLELVYAGMIAIFVLTTVEIGLHEFVLRKTYFNNMPYIFLCVATSFSGKVHPNWGAGWVQGVDAVTGAPVSIHPQFMIWILVLCGMAIATGFVLMVPKIIKKFAPDAPPPPIEE